MTDTFGKRDLYRLTGNDDHTVPDRFGGQLSNGPLARDLAAEQITAAIQRIHEDTSGYPHFPWPRLDDITGPMCPEDLIIVAARTGGGKSLFLQNLWDAMITTGRYGLYVGLEQSPAILRTKWACLRHDIAPKLILAPKQGEQGSPAWDMAMHIVQEDFKWQLSQDVRKRAHFASTRKINAKGLLTWTEWAVDHGAEFVIIDHIDRVQHGDGKNSFHEMSETIRLAKELAVKHRIVMILASQVGRPADTLEQFMPPNLYSLRGGGTKEEEADTVLGVYRPLKDGVGNKEMTTVRQGQADKDTVLEPNVMAVQVLKHRLDGPMAGKMVKLHVRHQKVTDLPEKDWYSSRDV